MSAWLCELVVEREVTISLDVNVAEQGSEGWRRARETFAQLAGVEWFDKRVRCTPITERKR